ncbi:MerR family transcriptional regulator [Mesobacillus foraminis]|uniref:MerR family transcriptional regulator n=1 Tax=Mesobacillus foraminis TaxID=279826 RepID=UPI0039A3D840
MTSYKEKKVISIGIVSELTGLSLRKIRYYEERGLITPERIGNGGSRRYSFADVETLMKIAEKREEGVQTSEIKKELVKERNQQQVRNQMIRGQINAHFNIRK